VAALGRGHTDPVLVRQCRHSHPTSWRRVVAITTSRCSCGRAISTCQRILPLYEQHRDPKSTINPAILDFGCGAVAWSDSSWAPRAYADVHATDVNPDHVEWCRKNLKGIAAATNNASPPSAIATRHSTSSIRFRSSRTSTATQSSGGSPSSRA